MFGNCKSSYVYLISGKPMRNHVIGLHPEELKLTCPYCARRYFSETGIEAHERLCAAKAKFRTNQSNEYFAHVSAVDKNTMDVMVESGEYDKEYLRQLIDIAQNEINMSMIDVFILEKK